MWPSEVFIVGNSGKASTTDAGSLVSNIWDPPAYLDDE